MKVLFICLEGFPDGGACSVLLNKLAAHNELRSSNDIHILAVKTPDNDRTVEQYGQITVHRFSSLSFLCTKDIIRSFHKHPIKAMRVLTEKIRCRLFQLINFNRSFLSRSLEKDVRKGLRDVKGEAFDVIVPISGFYEASSAALRFAKRHKIPMIFYQVDPCTTNRLYPAKSYYKRLRLERQLYDYCSHIVTTPIIFKEMNGLLAKTDMEKAVTMMFPNVEPKHSKGVSDAHLTDSPACVFAGRIYSGARDPRFTVEVFSHLHSDDICLKLVGVDRATLSQYTDISALPPTVECCGSLPFGEAQAEIEKADILVNIGNSVINQLPSKLFEYISSGKPIVNICTSHDCPSIPYMDRYKLAINLFACDGDAHRQAQLLKRFIYENAGKRLAPEQITEQFSECTAAHCAAIISEAIQDTAN